MTIFKIVIILVYLVLCGCEQGVLEEHVKSKFCITHNKHRIDNKLPLITWSWDLAAKAKINALELAANCFINSHGNNGQANIGQSWGVRSYTPDKIIKNWMIEGKSRKIILSSDFVGCAYASCPDRWDYAYSIIYVCYYSKKDNDMDDNIKAHVETDTIAGFKDIKEVSFRFNLLKDLGDHFVLYINKKTIGTINKDNLDPPLLSKLMSLASP